MPSPRVLDLSPIQNDTWSDFGASFTDTLNKNQYNKENEDIFRNIPGLSDEQDFAKRTKMIEEAKGLHPDYRKQKLAETKENAKFLMEQDEKKARNKYYETLAKKADNESLNKGERKKAFIKAYPEYLKELDPETVNDMSVSDLNSYVSRKVQLAGKKPGENGGFIPGTPPKPNDPSLKIAAKHYESLIKEGDVADETLRTVKDARQAIEKGGGEPGFRNYLGNIIPAFKSGETATLENSGVQLFKHFKTIFPKMTNLDVHKIEAVLPAVGTSNEANNASLDIFESAANFAKEKKKIANDLWEQVNEGKIPPYKFQSMLDDAIGEMEEEAINTIIENADAINNKVFERVESGYTPMVGPDGKLKQIPNEQVEKALKSKKWRLYGK